MMIPVKREIKLAVTALAALVILIWGINFLKAKALFDNNNLFYAIYDRVDGLKVSSSVMYRGYNVGQVNSIKFVGDRFDKVLVEFTVGNDLEIPVNSIAAIQSADLMGSKAIDLLPGDASVYAVSGDTLQSRLSLGLMEQLNKQLEPLKRKAENVMVSLDTVLVALQDIFNEGGNGNIRTSLKSVGRTLDHVENASGTLDQMLSKESGRISDILEDIHALTSTLKDNNDNISRGMENMATISDSLKAVDLSHTIRGLNNVLAQTDEVLKKINDGEGTLGCMLNDDELYYYLTRVSENLNKVLTEFRQNPKRFVHLSVFGGGDGKPMEINNYGIVVEECKEALPLNDKLYISHPDLKQIKRNGMYLYLIRTYSNINQAKKDLKAVQKTYRQAYIVKIY